MAPLFTSQNRFFILNFLPSSLRALFSVSLLDIYSRKIVGWEIHSQESGELASELINRTVITEKYTKTPIVLHSDNGAPMTSSTFKAKLADLRIIPSHSRPRVSNDNAFAESVFKTVKYCPQWPSQGFLTLDDSRQWMLKFERFYNHQHRHSSIQFVTLVQCHEQRDVGILKHRKQVYNKAREANPSRWSGQTRNWEPVGAVALNPERISEPEMREKKVA